MIHVLEFNQWASALSYEKNSFYNYTFVRCNGVIGIPIQIKVKMPQIMFPVKWKNFFVHYSAKHFVGIPYNSTGKTIVERSTCTLKELLFQTEGGYEDPQGEIA